MDTRKVVSDILAKRIDISNLKEEDSLKNIGLDSLDLVEVMLEIEDTLGIEFDSEEIAEFDMDILLRRDVISLLRSYIKISDPKVQRSVIDLIIALSGGQTDNN